MKDPVIVVNARRMRRRLMPDPSAHDADIVGAQKSSLDRRKPFGLTDTVVVDKGDDIVRRFVDNQVARARNISFGEKAILNRQSIAKTTEHRLSVIRRSVVNH